MVAWKYPLMKGRYLPADVTQRFGAFLEYLVTHGTSPFRIVCSWLKTDLEKGQLILPGSVVQLRGRAQWDEMRKQCVPSGCRAFYSILQNGDHFIPLV